MRSSDRWRQWGIGLSGLCVGLLALAWNGPADEPPRDEGKLPWQRRLQGDEAQQAESLRQRIDEAWNAAQFPEALAAAKELLALRERLQGSEHWEVADARQLLRTLEKRAGFNEEQKAGYRNASVGQREANDLYAQGRYAQAQPLLEQSLTTFRQLLGEPYRDTAASYNNLAYNLQAQGKYAEAEDGYRKALALERKLLGEEHPDTA